MGVFNPVGLCSPLMWPLMSPFTTPAVPMEFNTPPVLKLTTSGFKSVQASPFL
jgi:hypothetical protein